MEWAGCGIGMARWIACTGQGGFRTVFFGPGPAYRRPCSPHATAQTLRFAMSTRLQSGGDRIDLRRDPEAQALSGKGAACGDTFAGVPEVPTQPTSYKRHRFPPEVTRYTVWLYFRFALSLRDVEDTAGAATSTSALKMILDGL